MGVEVGSEATTFASGDLRARVYRWRQKFRLIIDNNRTRIWRMSRSSSIAHAFTYHLQHLGRIRRQFTQTRFFHARFNWFLWKIYILPIRVYKLKVFIETHSMRLIINLRRRVFSRKILKNTYTRIRFRRGTKLMSKKSIEENDCILWHAIISYFHMKGTELYQILSNP